MNNLFNIVAGTILSIMGVLGISASLELIEVETMFKGFFVAVSSFIIFLGLDAIFDW